MPDTSGSCMNGLSKRGRMSNICHENFTFGTLEMLDKGTWNIDSI